MEDQSEGSTATSQSPSEINKREEESGGDQLKLPVMQMLPGMYPALIPNFTMGGNQEHPNRGAGLYAVPILPFAGSVAGQLSNSLIPLTYTVPTRRASSSEGLATGQENQPVGQGAQQPHQQQQGGPQGPVIVRRFEIAIHLNIPLLLKLLAMIYLFHQDGSRQKLALLVFIACIIYLYQTGALAPLTQWLTRAMHRVPQPARPPRDALPPDDADLGNENAAQPAAERQQPEGENENQPAGDRNPQVENNQQHDGEEPGQPNVNPWWGLVKEIQIIVLGFITSLLPGFQHPE